jgi:hypothetical protein
MPQHQLLQNLGPKTLCVQVLESVSRSIEMRGSLSVDPKGHHEDSFWHATPRRKPHASWLIIATECRSSFNPVAHRSSGQDARSIWQDLAVWSSP